MNRHNLSDLMPFLQTLETIRPDDIPLTNGEYNGKKCPKCGHDELENNNRDVWCLGFDCGRNRYYQMRNTYKMRA